MFSRKLFLIVVFAFCISNVFAQQMVLGKTPYLFNKSAVLDLNADNQGLLLPRITDTTAINNLTPPDGMLIYFVPLKKLLVRTNGYWTPCANTTSSLSGLMGDVTTTGSGLVTATITNNAVSNSKFRQSLGLSVVGNTTNATSNVDDIVAANDGEVLRRSGTTLGFGQMATAGIANGAVTYQKLQNISTNNRLLGRATTGAGVAEEISLGTGLSLSGTTLDVGSIPNSSLANSSIGIATGTSGTDFNVSTASVSLGGNITFNLPSASSTARGLLTSTDWSTFNNKQNALSFGNLTTATSGVSITGGSGAVIGSGAAVNIQNANSTQNGLLTSTDWNTFNNKVATSRTINTTAPLTGGGDLSADRTISMTQASATTNGWLSSADWNTFNNKGGGSVTSVGLSLPSIFTVSNSPVTGSGTLTGALASQTQNLVLASPNGSAGTPSFRSIVKADLPSTVVYTDQANTYTAGMKQIFQANATNTGLKFGGVSADPSLLTDGDVWHNTTSNVLKYRVGGTTRTIVNTDEVQTITNKTINSSYFGSNTFTNVSYASYPVSSGYGFEIRNVGSANEYTYLTAKGKGTGVAMLHLGSETNGTIEMLRSNGTNASMLENSSVDLDFWKYQPTLSARPMFKIYGYNSTNTAKDYGTIKTGDDRFQLEGIAYGGGNIPITLNPNGGGVAVGTSSLNASAVLDVTSTTKGFLPPRLTTTQRDAISSPAAGLTIYNTTTNQLNFYDGSSWGNVSSSGNIVFNNQSNTYVAGMKQIFRSNATNAGLSTVGVTADPSTLTAGDVWYRSDLGRLSYYHGGTSYRIANTSDIPTNNNQLSNGSNYLVNSISTSRLWGRTTAGTGAVEEISIGSGLSLSGGVLTSTVPSMVWTTTGNAGTTPSTNFIGTTDNNDLVVKTNNTERVRIENTGDVGIGTSAPATRLDLLGDLAFRQGSFNASNGNSNHNIDIGRNTFIRVTGSTAGYNITGIAGGVDGRVVILLNATANSMTLVDESSSSDPANRIWGADRGNVPVRKYGSVMLVYSAADSRWITVLN